MNSLAKLQFVLRYELISEVQFMSLDVYASVVMVMMMISSESGFSTLLKVGVNTYRTHANNLD